MSHFWQLVHFPKQNYLTSEAFDARQGARHGCPTSGYVSDAVGECTVVITRNLAVELTAKPSTWNESIVALQVHPDKLPKKCSAEVGLLDMMRAILNEADRMKNELMS